VGTHDTLSRGSATATADRSGARTVPLVPRDRYAVAPWLEKAVEVWAAVLKPFRHLGECNYLDQTASGPLFASSDSPPASSEPIAIVTTVGWTVCENLDMNRVREFSNGAAGVRASMTGIEGLHSQQSFFFPGVLQYDALTVTLWRDAASARASAYGPGRTQSANAAS
jgi:hypothetical protein